MHKYRLTINNKNTLLTKRQCLQPLIVSGPSIKILYMRWVPATKRTLQSELWNSSWITLQKTSEPEGKVIQWSKIGTQVSQIWECSALHMSHKLKSNIEQVNTKLLTYSTNYTFVVLSQIYHYFRDELPYLYYYIFEVRLL